MANLRKAWPTDSSRTTGETSAGGALSAGFAGSHGTPHTLQAQKNVKGREAGYISVSVFQVGPGKGPRTLNSKVL